MKLKGLEVNKYRNKKVAYKDIKFDSIKERNRYITLENMKNKGEIEKLECQPCYILQEAFNLNGERYRAIKYYADFRYIKNGKTIVEDVKSNATKTAVYKIKKKLLLNKYRDVIFKEVI